MATLADVIRSKRKSGQSRTGSFFGSLKDKLKETIDPRQLFNQSGMLTALFPSLKAYKAKGVGEETGKLIQRRTAELSNSPQSMNGGMDFSAIEQNTKISAVNSMALPGLSRDINVMRQNISKLVKVVGLKPATKADNFFKKSSEREKEYESKFKTRPKLTGPNTTISDEEEKSKGFLASLLSIVGGLIKAVITTIGKIISTLFTLLKGLMTILFAALKKVFSLMLSLIKNIFTMLAKTIGIIINKLGSALLSVMGFIKSAILPFLQKLFMGPFGAALILAALTYMGLQHLAKDFIKGKRAQGRLKELRQLQKDGKLTPELEDEMKALEEAGVTATMGEATRNTVKRTIDLTTVQGLLDDPTRSDKEIQESTGVSREVLEAYREALNNRELYRKSGIPVPDLVEVARSFGETVDRTAPTPFEEFQTEETSIKRFTIAELNRDKVITGSQNTTVIARAADLLKQQKNTGSQINSGTLDLGMLAEETGSYTNTQSVTIPSQSTPSTGGATRQCLPSTINPDCPTFTVTAGGWT